MDKALLLLLLVSVGILSMSCDDLLNQKSQFRCYIEPTMSSAYVAVGTYRESENECDAVIDWVSADGSEFIYRSSIGH